MRRPSQQPAGRAFATLLGLLGCTLALSACGGVSSDLAPLPPVHGDSMTMTIDGGSTRVTESGPGSFVVTRVPAMTFTGRLGCPGRFFTGSYSSHIDFHFNYSAKDAYLLIGNADLLHFPNPPAVEHGNLVWRRSFDGRNAVETVECPPPPKGSGPLSALG